MRCCLVVLALAGCSRPRSEPAAPPHVSATATPDTAPAAPPDAAIAPVGDASPSSATVDAAVAFRAFVPPEPIKSPGPPTPHDKGCRKDGAGDIAHERKRELAALDAELRKQGGMLLPVQVHPFARGGHKPGAIIRGRHQERFMVVAEVSLCDESQAPLVALTATGEVFIVRPEPKPAKRRTVTLCENTCGGCGAEPAPSMLGVEVPDGAGFVGARPIKFAIDVQSTLTVRRGAKMCQPVP